MATVQATSTVVPAQARSARAATAWPPPSSGHTRPWRSSPLAGPAFSTLPPVIPESSEESHENERSAPDGVREPPRTRSPSLVSQTGSLTASGYGSRNASGSASALVLVEGEASTSSVSLAPSTGAHGTSSSQSHGSPQAHSNRPARLSKSWGRRTSQGKDDFAPPKNVSNISITPPPRARTVSHGHSRSASFLAPPISPSPTIPQAYSRATPRPRTSPESEANTTKQPPSKSRDPTSNWMSSSPFGPAQTPKFSRLAMASPAVVMPLSAKEYRKQKARESTGKGVEKDPATSSHRVTFIDNALSAFQSPNGVPVVKVSSPPSDDDHEAPSSSGDHSSDRRSQPQPQAGHTPSKPLPQASMSPRPSSPKRKRLRSRPNTPPRSSPLAVHPPISPKSSTGTFFSLASGSDDDTIPPARPRPRLRRRKSYPDRLSNGARLSLLEAMNRLSQESTSQIRLSGHSQTDGVNRLSVASQASGHTLFYDVGEPEGEKGQVTNGYGKGDGNADGGGQCTPVLHTQSLEDLSSTLARTGIEVVRPNGDGDMGGPSGDERKGKRNVRTVRISDTVEVSPPPVSRRRKLTKLRPVSARGPSPAFGAGPVPGTGPVKEVKVQTQTQTQPQERRASLLPWKSKGSSDNKAGVVSAGSGATAAEKNTSMVTKGLIHPNETTTPLPVPHSQPPIANGSAHESHAKPKSSGTPPKKTSSDTPASMPMAASSPVPEPFPPPRKPRRYTFSFLSSSTFPRSKREKSNTAPPSVDLDLDQNTKGKLKGNIIGIERSGTDSTSTSIRTITQGSQSTLVPSSPVLYDLTTPASSGGLSGRGTKWSVPMLRRLNAQEMAAAGVPSQSEWEDKCDSTPSLITNGSTATSSSSPRTPSFRVGGGGELFVPRPSALKESFTDTSEEDSEGGSGGGRTSRMCMHRRHEPSPLTYAGVGWGEMSEEEELHLRPDAGPRFGSRPGTSSSTLTTATETSGSYLSFSTVPASTTSSSSTSRSESPSPVGDKRDGVLSVLQGGDGDEEVYACTMCGHRSTSPLSLRSFSPSPTRDPDLEGMHPMFTVPLVTIPASVLMQCGRDTGTGHDTRYAGGQKSERHTSVPVPAAANVSVPPTRPSQNSNHMHLNGSPVTTSTKPRTTAMAMAMAMNDKVITTTIPVPPSPSPVPPPVKMKKRSRPQTAPAGTGDAALKFIEDAKAMRARGGGVDFDTLIGGDHSTQHKHKSGSGESKFKAVLKGLLRWGGERRSSW